MTGKLSRALLFAAVLSLLESGPAQTWVVLDREPLPRRGHELVPSPTTGRLLCLHGRMSEASGPVLERVGRQWRAMAAAGPSRRVHLAAATDPTRARVVLFGGEPQTRGPILGDTWEFDGNAWTLRSLLPSPTARSHAEMSWHAGSGRIVLFGGVTAGSGVVGDTWTYDGTTWTQPAVPSPGPRIDHSMVYDAARDVVVLFGGEGPAGRPTDTWEWDGVRWTQATVTGPPARFNPPLAFDPVRRRVVLFGGTAVQGIQPLRDTWEYDGVGWVQLSPPTVPPGRHLSAMAFDGVLGRVVLLGGVESRPLGAAFPTDTWEWDGTDWSVADANPRPVNTVLETTLASTPEGDALLFDNQDSPWDSTWLFRGGRWEKLPPTAQMPSWGTMTLDRVRGEVLMFGGWDFAGPTAATSVFRNRAWQQRMPATSPPPRHRHALACDPVRGRVVLFGGSDAGGNALNDTWEWDGASWTAVIGQGPGPRFEHAMAHDPAGGGVLLFGGSDGQTSLGDAWRWDGVSWQQLPGGPGPRRRGAMAPDRNRGGVSLVGGLDASGVSVDDHWLFSGGAWQRVGPIPPGLRWQLCESAGRGHLLLRVDNDLYGDLAASASSAAYGSGCPGTAGVPRLDSALRPVLGREAQELFLDRARSGSLAFLLGDFASAAVPLGSCTQLLLGPITLVSTITDNAGTGSWSLRIPDRNGLLGVAVYFQSAVFDPQGALSGLVALSNGVRLTLGR